MLEVSYDYDRSTARLGGVIRVDKPAIHELAREVEALVARKLEHKTGPRGEHDLRAAALRDSGGGR